MTLIKLLKAIQQAELLILILSFVATVITVSLYLKQRKHKKKQKPDEEENVPTANEMQKARDIFNKMN